MELDLERLESEFIAERQGNGDLWPVIMSDPENQQTQDSDDAFQVPFNFNYLDWNALYFGELKCPGYDPYVEGENFIEYENRWIAKFRQCCSDFPLLARIYDMYADAIYRPDEVPQLKAQCEALLSQTQNNAAGRALAKLIIICNKAAEHNKGILFSCD
jgi:hypothetical protein